MERKTTVLTHKKNPRIKIKVIHGHFTTSSGHLSHYIDVSGIKSNAVSAREAAVELAGPYFKNTVIDTIVCMEKTEVIGAYLAEEFIKGSVPVIKNGGNIHVVTPIVNSAGNLSFPGSSVKWIMQKNILLLVATVSSGRTLDGALDCLQYYGGKIAGISSLFYVSGADKEQETSINSLFYSEDIPGYKIYGTRNCEMCRAGQKLDALVSSEGYTKI